MKKKKLNYTEKILYIEIITNITLSIPIYMESYSYIHYIYRYHNSFCIYHYFFY